jgi:hypothetical protein
MSLVPVVVLVEPLEHGLGLEKDMSIVRFSQQETVKENLKSSRFGKSELSEINIADEACQTLQRPVFPWIPGGVLSQKRVECDLRTVMTKLSGWEVKWNRPLRDFLPRAHKKKTRLRVDESMYEPS